MIFPGEPRVDTAAALAARLRAEIANGTLRPGQRLPSETTLMQTYGLARGTVAKAVKSLRIAGLATFVRGYGVVVREPIPREDVTIEPGSTVEIRMPWPEEAEAYNIDEGVPVFIVADPAEPESGQLYPSDRYQIRVPD